MGRARITCDRCDPEYVGPWFAISKDPKTAHAYISVIRNVHDAYRHPELGEAASAEREQPKPIP